MLQVPGSVDAAAPAATSTDSTSQERSAPGGGAASPTLSAYSDHSGPASPQHTTRALRENDPQQQQQQQQSHQRETSASTQPDSQPQPQASTSAAGAASSTEKESSSHPKGEAERAPIAVKADKEAEKRSHWSRFKAIFTGNTRSARAAAAAKAVEEEKERQKNVDPRPFHFKPYTLGELVDPKSVAKLRGMGGIDALIDGLGTDAERGLDLPIRTAEAAPGDEAPKRLTDVEDQQGSKVAKKPSSVEATIEDRERVFGRNVLPQKKPKSLLLLMWIALQDKVLIILIIAAIVSLILGFYTDFVAPPELLPCNSSPDGLCEAPDVDWVEGLAILIAVTVVVTVGSVNDYGKERQLQRLNAQKEERDVKVIRQGKPGLMSVHDVQVGDILQLEPGEVIPADGVFLRGHNVKCDESGATGESDLIKKASYADCLAELEAAEANGTQPSKRDPFLISGSRVQEGVGEYVVTSVGTMSFNGKLMMSLHSEAEDTPLQSKLNHLAEIIAKLGAAAGLLLFIVLFIRFLAQLKDFPGTANDKGQRFISVLILAVTVVVVAIPEGLPLAVTLALAFATRRMAKQNLLVRLLGSCETMGAATVICTDKTGTLTQNQMSVVAGSAGIHCKFVRQLENHQGRVAKEETEGNTDWAIDQSSLGDVVAGPLRELFNDSIAVNSTAFEEAAEDEEEKKKLSALSPMAKLKALFSPKAKAAAKKAGATGGFVGSKTETALLSLAKDLGWEDYRVRRKANEVVTSFPFSSERKAMGVVVKKTDGSGYRFFVKGASEVITALCSEVVDMPREASNEVNTAPITEDDRANLTRTIAFYANQTLRTLGLAYRDFPSWPPKDASFVKSDAGEDSNEVDYKSIAKDMTLLSVVAIEDPLRDGVADAVQATYRAGLRVIMVTGDNSLTARSIAAQCGIYDPAQNPVIMEGPVFRTLNESDLREVVPRLRVLARSSPQDKQKLVEALKSMGEIVAVTGDGTNDAAALKAANVGFSMGVAGTEVAKEASDIILLDDRFSSIVTALLWGRCVRNAVRKFLQFQLAVNVGAVIITFVTSVASEDESGALTAVQLLWLNVLMDSLAALALATDPPSDELLKQKPERPNTSLISIDMWKMILGQATYQVALVLVLYFAGAHIFGIEAAPGDEVGKFAAETTIKALTFNTFVFATLFNQVNARRLDRRFNIFQDLFKNPWFLAILAFEVGAQVLIMFVGGKAFSVERLEGKYWAVAIVAGFISWPLGVLIKLIPTEPIERFAIRWGLISDPLALPYDAPDAEEAHEKLKGQKWSEPGLMDLADELGGYSRRGKRATLLSHGWSDALALLRHPSAALPHKTTLGHGEEGHGAHSVHPAKFGILMPGISIAGLAGAWRPQNPPEATLADPAAGDPSLSSWQLMRRGTNLRDEEGGATGAGKEKEAEAGKGQGLRNKFKGLMGGA
ncbi:calcium-translocating P-type ATPase [Jaminaea rosea]|uniref:P-type Ca(2+) transporter n=1 Tax=Jaminaea rosea TaxID=1569628 RepID=A0A316UM06_9BASI|nr:calcium-translocating P-type ATPase [Jaminaea rosea]PWN25411.1 calcium-translocating P-type ATPase [Jaminaea rosea]